MNRLPRENRMKLRSGLTPKELANAVGGRGLRNGLKLGLTRRECKTVRRVFDRVSATGNSGGAEHQVEWDGLVCHPKGTKVSLKDRVVNIEDVTFGEKVLTYNVETGEVEEKRCEGVEKFRANDNRITITHEFGVVESTIGHPYYTRNKGWVGHRALHPAMAELTPIFGINFSDVLSEGDVGVFLNNEGEVVDSRILSIQVHDQAEFDVYKILNVEDHHCFFANGIVSHNKVTTVLDIVAWIADG